jgi:polyisoprenoid-binding protein YceI
MKWLILFIFPFFIHGNSNRTALSADAPAWTIIEGYKISFTISNFGSPVHGTLSDLKGEIRFSHDNPESGKFDVTIPVSTIKTGIKKRDKDLMAEKYFDAAKYPLITFKSETITKKGSKYIVIGVLTIKGHPHNIELPFDFKGDNETGTFTAGFIINRLDYGIGGTGKIMGKEITIAVVVPVKKAKV